eukprot:5986845-Alexandrium_andersonii.AAC.1
MRGPGGHQDPARVHSCLRLLVVHAWPLYGWLVRPRRHQGPRALLRVQHMPVLCERGRLGHQANVCPPGSGRHPGP